MADNLATLADFFVPDQHIPREVLVWGVGGVLEPADPQPVLLRASYLSGNTLETHMEGARLAISAPVPKLLLCLLPAHDSPPSRMARLFQEVGSNVNAPHRDRSGHIRSVPKHQYYAAQSGSFAWDTDISQGLHGFFLTGDANTRSLWRVERIDQDAFKGPIFTIAPIEHVGGFPSLDLSSIEDPLQRAEVSAQYDELRRSVTNGAYRGVVSRAKDIAEALLPLRVGLPSSKNFSETLNKVRERIDSKQTSVTPLTYHLCEKLRYLHQRTHPARAVQHEGFITPELALTVAHDLFEVLRDLGYTKQ